MDQSDEGAEIIFLAKILVDYLVEDVILFALIVSAVYILNLFLEDEVLKPDFRLVFVEQLRIVGHLLLGQLALTRLLKASQNLRRL